MKREYAMFDMPWRLQYNKVRGEGGREIDRFLSAPEMRDTASGSEAWIASTTRANGATGDNPHLGCSRVELPDGSVPFLFDVINQNPEEILGPAHVREYGNDLGILVKLLDAKTDYLLQSHPSRAIANRLWDFPYGKQECWHVLSVRTDTEVPPCILLGFAPGITRERFAQLYRQNDIRGLESLCNRIAVRPGDTYFVPDGMPHALGAGCFVIELQESSDLTAIPISQQDLIEYRQRVNPKAQFSPISNDVYENRMLDTFDYQGYTQEEIIAMTRSEHPLLRKADWGEEILLIGRERTDYFSCTCMHISGEAPLTRTDAYRIALVTDGEGAVVCRGRSLPVRRGDGIFFPYSVRNCGIRGGLEVVLCNPASGAY